MGESEERREGRRKGARGRGRQTKERQTNNKEKERQGGTITLKRKPYEIIYFIFTYFLIS